MYGSNCAPVHVSWWQVQILKITESKLVFSFKFWCLFSWHGEQFSCELKHLSSIVFIYLGYCCVTAASSCSLVIRDPFWVTNSAAESPIVLSCLSHSVSINPVLSPPHPLLSLTSSFSFDLDTNLPQSKFDIIRSTVFNKVEIIIKAVSIRLSLNLIELLFL